MSELTITGKKILSTFERYIEDNKNAPKNEQTEAYKNLENLCKEHNIEMDELVEYIKNINGVD